ncbi:hypothetical protein ACFLEY_22260 [Bradyrhizobium sp. YCK136]|uniref:hypothetical protein n=1 Tax=Bradyrhizobium sp. YCK136 TaxID=3351346 RepID=UPI0037C8FC71
MKLYSVTDLTKVTQQAMRELGLTIVSSSRGNLVLRQTSGIVSQNFKIKIEDSTPEST